MLLILYSPFFALGRPGCRHSLFRCLVCTMPLVIVQRALFLNLDSCSHSSETHVVDPSSPFAVRGLPPRYQCRPPLFHISGNLVGENVPALGPPVLQRPAPRPRPDPAEEAMSALAHQPARPRHRGPGAAADLGGAKDGAGGDGRLGDDVCDGGLRRRGRQGQARRRGAEDGARGPGEGRAQRREGCECPPAREALALRCCSRRPGESCDGGCEGPHCVGEVAAALNLNSRKARPAVSMYYCS